MYIYLVYITDCGDRGICAFKIGESHEKSTFSKFASGRSVGLCTEQSYNF